MARIGGAAANHPVALGAELAGYDDARHARQQHDRHHVGAQLRHQAADRRQGNQRLSHADHLKHHAKRPRSHFVVGVAQRVVGVGVLEALHVERRCLFQNAQADAVLQCVAQELARRAVDRLQQRCGGAYGHLQAQEQCEPAIRDLLAGKAAANCERHRID